METRIGLCPLGSQCEEIKDNIKYICPWYVKVQGKDPQTDQHIDEWRCAIAWMPTLQIEHSLFERQTGAAVESFRNEMANQNNIMIAAVHQEKLEGG